MKEIKDSKNEYDKQPRILITDDEPSILSVCREYFRNEGYEVYTAPNAKEALEFLSEEIVDVVITDINKPGMRGWELTEIIKKKYDADVIMLGAILNFVIGIWMLVAMVIAVRQALDYKSSAFLFHE